MHIDSSCQNCAMILNTMLDERQDDSFETLIEV